MINSPCLRRGQRPGGRIARGPWLALGAREGAATGGPASGGESLRHPGPLGLAGQMAARGIAQSQQFPVRGGCMHQVAQSPQLSVLDDGCLHQIAQPAWPPAEFPLAHSIPIWRVTWVRAAALRGGLAGDATAIAGHMGADRGNDFGCGCRIII